MKRIFLITILSLIALTGFSQWLYPNTSYGTRLKGILGDSAMLLPTGCGSADAFRTLYAKRDRSIRRAAFYADSCNSKLYLYNPKDSAWHDVGSGSFDTTAIYDTITRIQKTVYSSDGSITFSLNNDSIDIKTNSTVVTLVNQLISTGGVILEDSTVSIVGPIIYRLNGIKDTIGTGTDWVFHKTAINYKRVDAIIINNAGILDTLVGIPDTIIAVPRLISSNALLISYINVYHDSISTPTIANTVQLFSIPSVDSAGKLRYDSLALSMNQNTKEVKSAGGFLVSIGKRIAWGDASTSIYYDGTNFLNFDSYDGNFTWRRSNGGLSTIMQLYDNNGSTSTGYINLKSFGIGTASPNASAALDVTSTIGSFIPPRMNSTQMNALISPPDGSLLYNPDSAAICLRTGGTWRKLNVGAGGGSGWSLTGNAGTDPTISFLGTTDAQPLYLRVNNDTIAKFGTNTDNISMGADCHATGATSFAVGTNNIASGDNSTAIGYGNISSGFLSTTIGGSASATGESSIAIGTNSTATGDFSVAIGGGNNNTNGASSFAIGNNNVSTGTNSLSIGNSLESKSINSIVLGKYNDYSGQSDDDTLVILQVGNGYNNFSRSNAMTILQNGNVGIGTTTPDSGLTLLNKGFKYDVASKGAGKVLTSDANGAATWQTPSILDTTSLSNRINLKANISSPTFTGLITADTIKPLRIRFASTGGIQGASSINFDGNSTATTNGISYGQFNLYRDASSSFTIGSLTTKVGNLIMTNGSQLYWANRSVFSSSADGKINLTNNSVNNFTSLGFGLETSAFPAIFRSGTIAQFRLGDNSDDAPISVSTVKVKGYTVATLPAAGTAGRMAYVTDALAPTFLGVLTGGGTVVTPVFDNGTAWVAH